MTARIRLGSCARCLVGVGLAALVVPAVGCKRGEDLGSMKVPADSPPTTADPAFNDAWKGLSEKEVFYIEDDRGDGLMGRVLRGDSNRQPTSADLRDTALGVGAKTGTLPGAGTAGAAPTSVPGGGGAAGSAAAVPEALTAAAVSAVVRQRMGNVKYCYLSVTRKGKSLSGRAIVSFTVNQNGGVGNVRVDAPAFRETGLATCVSKQVEHWSFPRSRTGGFAVSYPFVFVGG